MNINPGNGIYSRKDAKAQRNSNACNPRAVLLGVLGIHESVTIDAGVPLAGTQSQDTRKGYPYKNPFHSILLLTV
jgi:hypothetical protein